MFVKPIAKYLAIRNCILIYLYAIGNYTKLIWEIQIYSTNELVTVMLKCKNCAAYIIVVV